jgi:hypothetical protein
MRGAIPPLPQYVFMAWCLGKHRDSFTSLPLCKSKYIVVADVPKHHSIMAYRGAQARLHTLVLAGDELSVDIVPHNTPRMCILQVMCNKRCFKRISFITPRADVV